LVREQSFSLLSANLQGMAQSIMESDDPERAQAGLRFKKELDANMDLYAQFIVDALSDAAWGRKPGAPESKDLAGLLRPVDLHNFRNFYHRICFVKSEKLVRICEMAGFDRTERNNGMILYGYIDRGHGLSFLAICCANIAADGSIENAQLAHNISLRISPDNIQDAEFFDVMETNCDVTDFLPFIERQMYFEDNSLQLDLMRRSTDLDPLRHPEFPDDIRVVLYKEGMDPEQVWVRCSAALNDSGLWVGKLLNEPFKDYGCHDGDEIIFQYVISNELVPFCYYLGNAT
jgi:hypothetical protein